MDYISPFADQVQQLLCECQSETVKNADTSYALFLRYNKLAIFSKEVLNALNSNGPNFNASQSRTFRLMLQFFNTYIELTNEMESNLIRISRLKIKQDKFRLMKLVCHVDVSTEIPRNSNPFNATFRCLYVEDVTMSEPDVYCDIVSGSEVSKLQGFVDSKVIINRRLLGTRTAKLMYKEENCWATFNRIQLSRAQPSFDPKVRSVPTEKCALLFYTNISINNQPAGIWALFHPVVQISHMNQVAAGTIFWVNYFPKINDVPFAVQNTAKCIDLTLAMVHNFNKRITNRPLTNINIYCICESLFPLAEDDWITSEVFLNRIWKGHYSYWEWFYNLLRLLKPKIPGNGVRNSSVHAIFEAGLISGFISNDKAGDLLSDQPVGTFLIRFSDEGLGALKVTKMTPNRVLASHELLNSDLRDKGLASCIYDIDGAEFLFSTFLRDVRSRDEALSPFIIN